MKKKRGGKRPGAGRPPAGRVPMTIRIKEALAEKVRAKAGGKVSLFFEGLLKKI